MTGHLSRRVNLSIKKSIPVIIQTKKKSVRFQNPLETIYLFDTMEESEEDLEDAFLESYTQYNPILVSTPIVKLVTLYWNSDLQVVQGSVMVENLAYEKTVVIRYSLDDWDSYEEVKGVYVSSQDSQDEFSFEIYPQSSYSIDLAVQYQVNQRVYWDNHDGDNYHLSWLKKKKNIAYHDRRAFYSQQVDILQQLSMASYSFKKEYSIYNKDSFNVLTAEKHSILS
ncbi:putative phosphatase regulatory subunit-domain-containing protein [Pilobolus umbonatus]|nr:putative phosphatase regulatory subunit-domain-containing protein [Pilobolus umbonatus]